jgi:hypothetical protein
MSQNKVTVLGNEGANSVETTSYLLEDDNGDKVIIDSSIYTYNKLVETDEIDNISDIMITHSHMDHVGGVPAIIQYKIDNNQPLNIIGGSDLKSVLNNMGMKDILTDSKYKDIIKLSTFKQNETKLEKVGILPFRVKHTSETIGKKTEFGTLESYGFALKSGNGKYTVITGDTSEIITPDFLNKQLAEKIGQDISFDDIQTIFQDVGETGNEMNGEPAPGFVHSNAYFIESENISKYKGIHVPISKLNALEEKHGIKLSRAEPGEVLDLNTNETTIEEKHQLSPSKIAAIEERMQENLTVEKEIDGEIITSTHNVIEGNVLTNPTAEFITKLSNDFLEGNDSRFKDISIIEIDESTTDLAVIIENALVQKRYYEGQRFNPNNEAVNDKLPFIKKLNLSFHCSTPGLEKKVFMISKKSIGLRVDNDIGKDFGSDFDIANSQGEVKKKKEEVTQTTSNKIK